MRSPAALDIYADRWVPFIGTLVIIGGDMTGAVFAMQVRLTPDATGSPLIDLAGTGSLTSQGIMAEFFSDTVANHVLAGRMTAAEASAYSATDFIELSVVRIRVNEATMEALPFPAERGDNATLAWDIQITPSGGDKDKYAGGAFIVRAGATV